MATYFFDSSGLVKRYVPETGSAWVKGLTEPSAGNLNYVVRITGAEVVSAVTRRQRWGQISPLDASAALLAFRRDFPAALPIIEVTPIVVARAMNLAEQYGLRGYDAVQLASALELRDQCRASGLPAPTLIAADNELNTAAAAEGLAVDDPNTH